MREWTHCLINLRVVVTGHRHQLLMYSHLPIVSSVLETLVDIGKYTCNNSATDKATKAFMPIP